MGEAAFTPITDAEREGASAIPQDSGPQWQPIQPVPKDAPRKMPTHSLGKPSAHWPYRDASAELLGLVVRFDNSDGSKECFPLTFCERSDGSREWRWKGFGAPRPIYNLEGLAATPDAPVLVVEGEKTAEAAKRLYPSFVCTTSPGGAKAAGKADWSPLKGRKVVVWPDHDEHGRCYASEVATAALDAGASSVAIVQVPDIFPEKWDLADELPVGITHDALVTMIEEARPIHEPLAIRFPPGYSMREQGLVWQEPGGEEKQRVWLCGPFKVLAHTRAKLMACLAQVECDARARAVARTGWHGRTFVLPDRSFGLSDTEPVLFQTVTASVNAFQHQGTLTEWQEAVACWAPGNSRLAFALSAAFAPPLLEIVGEPSGGFHFVGQSQTGKTTILRAAGSVWGGGGLNGYLRSWRATDNGLEGVAASHCDTLLCLDEMGQVGARVAGEIAYMLANGSGKNRAGRGGAARQVAEWRLMFLSTGEVTLADKLAEAGQRPRAGQGVRLVDISADAGAGLGIFEELDKFADAGALARHLKDAGERCYGTPAREFLKRLTSADRDELASDFRNARDEFIANFVPAGASGQVVSVASRFALVSAAGSLAVAFGILPWDKQEPERAAGRCFQDWLANRGSVGASERDVGVAQVQAFIEAHGTSRFELMVNNADAFDSEHRTINRVGFRERLDGRWHYYLLPEAFTKEVCKGLNAKQVTRDLVDAGYMQKGGEDRLQTKKRLPGIGPTWCYHILPKLLGGDDGDL